MRAHADTYVESWYEWNDHEPTFVVAFADDLTRHKRALSYPGVRVTPRAHPDPDLPMLAQALLEAEPPAGTIWWGISVDPAANVIEIKGTGTDEATAAAWLAERYGSRVRLTWEPPEEVRPVSWQMWAASPADPNTLNIHWQTNSVHRFERVEAEETPDSARITVFESQFKGNKTMMAAYRSAAVRLEESIGTRQIIDAVTGWPCPRL